MWSGFPAGQSSTCIQGLSLPQYSRLLYTRFRYCFYPFYQNTSPTAQGNIDLERPFRIYLFMQKVRDLYDGSFVEALYMSHHVQGPRGVRKGDRGSGVGRPFLFEGKFYTFPI